MCKVHNVKLKRLHLNDAAKRVATAELMVHKKCAKIFITNYRKKLPLRMSHMFFPFVWILCKIYAYLRSLYNKHFTWDRLQWKCFQFTISRKKTAKVYVHHEETEIKTPNEVCSFLYDYLKNVPQEITELRLFADNCSG